MLLLPGRDQVIYYAHVHYMLSKVFEQLLGVVSTIIQDKQLGDS